VLIFGVHGNGPDALTHYQVTHSNFKINLLFEILSQFGKKGLKGDDDGWFHNLSMIFI
jgi:hypothetical protein